MFLVGSGVLVLVAVGWVLARAFARHRETEHRYQLLVELCPDPIVVHAEGVILYANPASMVMVGATERSQVLGHPIAEFVHPDFLPTVIERVKRALATNTSSGMIELTLLRIDGDVVQTESTTMPISFGGKQAVQAVLRDITERKRTEEALAHQALHDALTGLPNRVQLLDQLDAALQSARASGSQLSLMLMDLDCFKEINDTLGHGAGDGLLQQVGARLRNALREAHAIARLGGDEFAVILPFGDAEQIDVALLELQTLFAKPFQVEGQPVVTRASVGIAQFPRHAAEAETLLRLADVAMYQAKGTTAGVAVYDAARDGHSPDRLMVIGDLRRAIDEGELILHFQPKVDVRDGGLAGVEALVRWEHPLRGLVPPDDFIGVAEQAGLIDALSRWVLSAALRQCRAWRRIGLEIPVAVNLSARNLLDPSLPVVIAEMLAEYDLPARLLSVEITESTLMADMARALEILHALRRMGVSVAIDDFGTGHSSLAYLKNLPVDELKIDRSFVREISVDASDRAIVRATVDLAHSLGLRVVAEGVEDAQIQEVLQELGCDIAQGYHLSRPLRSQDVTHWLCERQASQLAA